MFKSHRTYKYVNIILIVHTLEILCTYILYYVYTVKNVHGPYFKQWTVQSNLCFLPMSKTKIKIILVCW